MASLLVMFALLTLCVSSKLPTFVAILRWQESASCYSLIGSAVFPKRRNEAGTPIVVDSKETFQFSVPTIKEWVGPISLWLTPYDLQKLTQ